MSTNNSPKGELSFGKCIAVAGALMITLIVVGKLLLGQPLSF